MFGKTVYGIVLTLVLLGVLILAFNIQPVKSSGTIYIMADGSVDGTTYIHTADYITYVFTANINDSIVVQKDSITVDGNGYTLQGSGSGNGISLTSINNVTIKNTNVKGFDYGICLISFSNNNTICGNNATRNGCGIFLSGSSNNNIISGNNATDNDDYGIYFEYSSNYNTVSGNNAANNNYGIRISSSSNNTVSGNEATGNVPYGIDFEGASNNNTICGNNAIGNWYGIFIKGSSSNTLRGNNMSDNTYNFHIEGLSLSDFVNDIDASNTVDGKPIYYLVNMQNMTVPLDAGYVALVNCTLIKVQKLNLTKNGQGILLAHTTNTTMTENNITNNSYSVWLDYSSNYNSISENSITNNSYGIWLHNSSNNSVSGNSITANRNYGINLMSSSNNTVSGNNARANGQYGIHTWSSSNNTVSGNNATNNSYGIDFEYFSNNNTICGNNVTDNRYGISLSNSLNNRFWHNNFIHNTLHNIDVETAGYANVWNDSYPSGGNYWSDYTGDDVKSGPNQDQLGSDGIGDTLYNITTNNIDYYPLKKPYPWEPHDVGVTCIGRVYETPFYDPSINQPIVSRFLRNFIGLNFSLHLDVFVMNYGDSSEGLNLTVYANDTVIGRFSNVTLAARNSTILDVPWNTFGSAIGDCYFINATLEPVLGETDVKDNKALYWPPITITIPGDVNGNGTVSMWDIGYIALHFGQDPSNWRKDPNAQWDPNADINDDGKIDMKDIAIAARNFNPQ